jgi:hypothetical protein
MDGTNYRGILKQGDINQAVSCAASHQLGTSRLRTGGCGGIAAINNASVTDITKQTVPRSGYTRPVRMKCLVGNLKNKFTWIACFHFSLLHVIH